MKTKKILAFLLENKDASTLVRFELFSPKTYLSCKHSKTPIEVKRQGGRLVANNQYCLMIHQLLVMFAERRERSEANNRILFEIPRYLYIYMSVCTCIAQDRAHLTQVLSRRPLCIWNTGCCSEHHFEESPFR